MEPWTITAPGAFLISMATAAVVAIIVCNVVPRLNRRRMRAWLATYDHVVETSTSRKEMLQQLTNLKPYPGGDWGLSYRMRDHRDYADRRRRNADKDLATCKEMSNRLAKALATTGDAAQYDMLKTIDIIHLEDAERQDFQQRLEELIPRYCEELLGCVRAEHSKAAWVALKEIVTPTPYDDTSTFHRYTGAPYVAPDDWDDLVAQLFENPHLADFLNVRTDQAPGAVRLMAAEALRTQSLREAKIVLAFCAQPQWRDEVGDVLTAELAKMVTSIHAQLGMFVQ